MLEGWHFLTPEHPARARMSGVVVSITDDNALLRIGDSSASHVECLSRKALEGFVFFQTLEELMEWAIKPITEPPETETEPETPETETEPETPETETPRDSKTATIRDGE